MEGNQKPPTILWVVLRVTLYRVLPVAGMVSIASQIMQWTACPVTSYRLVFAGCILLVSMVFHPLA